MYLENQHSLVKNKALKRMIFMGAGGYREFSANKKKMRITCSFEAVR